MPPSSASGMQEPSASSDTSSGGQGATDGILGTDPEEFKTISTQLMAILRREAGGDVPIIRLGIADKPAFCGNRRRGRAGHTKTTHGMKSRPPFRSIQSRICPIVNPDGIAIQADQPHYTTLVMCPRCADRRRHHRRGNPALPILVSGCWLIWTPRIPILSGNRPDIRKPYRKTRQTGKHRPNMISVSGEMIPSRPATRLS